MVIRKTSTVAALLFFSTHVFHNTAAAGPAPRPCDPALLQHIPLRASTASNGSEFARRVEAMSEDERERSIEAELLAGNIPAFLRRLEPVTFSSDTHGGRTIQVTVCVTPDYLAIGSNRDFIYVPMRLATALEVAGRYGFTLPTARIVDGIYEQSALRLVPQPLPAGDRMRSTGYYRHHADLIAEQRSTLGATLGVLTAGHKKDLVITNRLWRNPERVAIYGWHRGDHSPIQPLSTVHGARYADYSHGIRLVSAVVYVDGEPKSISDVLADPQLSQTLSAEGPIPRLAELAARLRGPAVDIAVAASGSNAMADLSALGSPVP
jgi:hypothetical protein